MLWAVPLSWLPTQAVGSFAFLFIYFCIDKRQRRDMELRLLQPSLCETSSEHSSSLTLCWGLTHHGHGVVWYLWGCFVLSAHLRPVAVLLPL